VTLHAVFQGRRGRLLAGLLLAEFAAAVQSVAYSAVLPLASRELGGSSLYGATLAAMSLSTIAVLAAGPRAFAFGSARVVLFVATGLFVVGVLAAALAPTMLSSGCCPRCWARC
jgi:MFS family permease